MILVDNVELDNLTGSVILCAKDVLRFPRDGKFLSNQRSDSRSSWLVLVENEEELEALGSSRIEQKIFFYDLNNTGNVLEWYKVNGNEVKR